MALTPQAAEFDKVIDDPNDAKREAFDDWKEENPKGTEAEFEEWFARGVRFWSVVDSGKGRMSGLRAPSLPTAPGL